MPFRLPSLQPCLEQADSRYFECNSGNGTIIAALSFPRHCQPPIVLLKSANFFAFSAMYACRFSPPSSVSLRGRPPRAQALLPVIVYGCRCSRAKRCGVGDGIHVVGYMARASAVVVPNAPRIATLSPLSPRTKTDMVTVQG